MSKKREARINRIRTQELKALKTKRRFKSYTKVQNSVFRRRVSKIPGRNRKNYLDNYQESTRQLEVKRIMKVPSKFSITVDIETVLKFIYDGKKIAEYGEITQLILDFTNVTRIDDGAATILLSFGHDMIYKNIKVGINSLPENEEARIFIRQSGFLKYFRGPLAIIQGETLNTTLKKGKSTILQKDSAKVIHKAMKTIWGIEKRNQKLRGMLIELMTNSVNHAYLNVQKQKSWYISTTHNIQENKVEFCFVDNGDGIINTINVKFRDKFFTSSEELLRRAFDGEFRSRTKLANRGRGLIVVKKNQENMTIKGLKVITNNVFLDFENKTAISLKTPFSGTFYSWIIDRSCK